MDMLKCPICGIEAPEETFVDTEGKINGGIGIVCDQCWEDSKS